MFFDENGGTIKMWVKAVRGLKKLSFMLFLISFIGTMNRETAVFALELKQTETQDRTPFFEMIYESQGQL